jgi:hypothetical protein
MEWYKCRNDEHYILLTEKLLDESNHIGVGLYQYQYTIPQGSSAVSIYEFYG